MQEESETLLQACMRTIQQQTFYNAYWKAFKIVQADSDEQRAEAFRLRYRVYCTEGPSGAAEDPSLMEKDAYDDRAIHYLLIHNTTGQAAGTVRVLLPKTSAPLDSFEMQKLCAHPLLENEDRAQHLAEISRLCMAWQFRRRPGDGRILPAYSEQEPENEVMPLGKPFSAMRRHITFAPLGLMMAAFEAVMDRGILDCISLMDPSDFRSLKRLGLSYKVLGPRVTAYGSQQPIVFNIKNALDNMEAANPECWEIITDKGRLARRANELQLENWNQTVFDDPAKEKLLGRFF